jgi:2-hydroxycyclohexanecarboxyl-CoA dehydrogenase
MTDRVALVTGGARGIGAAIVSALAAGGHAVAIGDLREAEAEALAEETRAGGGRAVAVALDVTDAASVRAAVEATGSELGPPDVLVNNAGWDQLRPFLETDEEFWDRILEINLKGCLRVTQAVLPAMIERGSGRVISLGSDAGRVGSSNESVYAAAKAGVIGFTKTLAREVARTGVTANVVCPGPTETPLLAEITGEGAEPEKLIAAMTRAVPMKRLGKPSEVAAAVAFLASEEAGYITGQTLSVSGGLTMV